MVLLTGGNGAGKTTLLRLIATAIGATGGGGRVLGFDLFAERRQIRARAEFLGHRTRLYDDLTPAEYLRLVAKLWRCRPGTPVAGALERVGLQSCADEPVRSLSQGSRQRLALARTFLRSPELLLADEPYSSLDVSGRALFDEMAAEIVADGGTVLLASHDVQHAELVATRRLEMDSGRVVADALLVPQ